MTRRLLALLGILVVILVCALVMAVIGHFLELKPNIMFLGWAGYSLAAWLANQVWDWGKRHHHRGTE